MNKIIYKRSVPILKFIFGAALFFLGLSILPSLFGSVICGLGIFLFHTDGVEIDLEKKRFRNIKSFFSLNFGKWKTLPDIEYVSVFKTSETSTVRSLGAQTSVKNEVIKVNLFYNTNQKITAYVTKEKQDAFKVAKQIAAILDIDILDATQRESTWL